MIKSDRVGLTHLIVLRPCQQFLCIKLWFGLSNVESLMWEVSFLHEPWASLKVSWWVLIRRNIGPSTPLVRLHWANTPPERWKNLTWRQLNHPLKLEQERPLQQLHFEKTASLFLYTKLKAKSRFKKEEKTPTFQNNRLFWAHSSLLWSSCKNHHPVWPCSSAEVKVEDTTFLGAVMRSTVQSFQGLHEQERDRLQEAKC